MSPILAAAEMPVEVDHFGTLLKAQHDVEFARPAAERDGLFDMVGDAGPALISRNIDVDRQGALAEDRLVGASDRDEILQIEATGAALPPGRARR